MRPQAHLPVPRGPTSTRATATGARLPISRVPRRILRKVMASSRVHLDRWLLTNTIVAETTGGGPARRTITRVARRLPRLPVTTTVTRRILQATRTTAGTCRSVLVLALTRERLLPSLLSPVSVRRELPGDRRSAIVGGAIQIESRNDRITDGDGGRKVSRRRSEMHPVRARRRARARALNSGRVCGRVAADRSPSVFPFRARTEYTRRGK